MAIGFKCLDKAFRHSKFCRRACTLHFICVFIFNAFGLKADTASTRDDIGQLNRLLRRQAPIKNAHNRLGRISNNGVSARRACRE